jgi:SAM-dependent methyltransferase
MRRLCWLALVVGVGVAAAAARGPDGKSAAAERQVLEATEALFRALDRLDADAVAKLTAEKYVLAAPGGGGTEVGTRAEQLAVLRRRKAAGVPAAPERAWRDLTARVTGDTAVVTGYTGRKGEGGQPDVDSLVTAVWVRAGGGWRAVLAQRTPAGPSAQADRWNDVFRRGAGTLFNPRPNALLARAVKGVKPGKALDVGMGQGRNAVYLATQGWDVTGVDPAEYGLAVARRSALEAKVRITPVLQTAEEFDWGESRWDLIAVIYMNPRGLKKQIRAALKPGGLLVVEGFHRDAARGRKIGAGVVFDTDELKKLLPDFEVVRYQEPVDVADYGLEKVRLVRLVARKKR